MIVVKFFGGAKKSFSTDKLLIEKSNMSIQELLDLILTLKPDNTPRLDIENILIAINGVDSSALDGKLTKLEEDDVVSIIPIIHGGSSKKLIFNISKKLIYVIEIRGQDTIDLLYIDKLRKKYPRIKFQAISSKFILNKYHLKKILTLSVLSEKKDLLLSNRLETDIIMRFALSSQISNAINSVGIKSKQNFILITWGDKKTMDSLCTELNFLSTELFQNDNTLFLKKYFKITMKQFDSINSINPLGDLLVEKAVLLI